MPYTLSEALNLSLTGILVVLIVLSLLAVILTIMGKVLDMKSPKVVEQPKVSAAPVPTVSKIPDEVSIFDVPDKTAAMVMAIIADETKIPLNELYFKTIREIKE